MAPVNPSTAASPASAHTGAPDPPNAPPKKRKKKPHPHILHASTFRAPAWTYFHLHLTTPSHTTTSAPEPSPLDPLTVSSLLAPALTSHLGLTGASIPVDILHTAHRAVTLRLPRQDARAFRAALSSWTGTCDPEVLPGAEQVECDKWGRARVSWRVVGEGWSLGAVVMGDEGELFGG